MKNRTFSRRNFVRFGVVGAGAVALAACVATPTPQVVEKVVTQVVAGTPEVVKETVVVEKQVTAAPAEAVSIVYMYSPYGAYETSEPAIIKEFEQYNPNIKVKGITGDWQKLQTLVAAKEPLDVGWGSPAITADYAKAGVFAPLDEFFAMDFTEDDFMPGTLEVHKWQGKLYGLSFWTTVDCLFYNKTLFDEAGVTYPTDDWTWDDFLAAALQITKTTGNIETDRWGVAPLSDPLTNLSAWVASNDGGNVLTETLDKCNLTNPKAIEAVQWVVDLALKHKVMPAPEAFEGISMAPFGTGTCALQEGPIWYYNQWKDVEDFKWDIAMVPLRNGKRAGYGGGGNPYCATTTCTHLKEAWEFIKYRCSTPVAVRFLFPGVAPIKKDALDNDLWYNRKGAPAHIKEVTVKMLDFSPNTMGFGSTRWVEWVTAANAELPPMFRGERTVQETMDRVCAAIDKVLQRV
ncbi:MAG: ABC transporter substrate-binding protein [Anaerolineae bacterium]